jgi:hypothetical protein
MGYNDRRESDRSSSSRGERVVYTPYITRNGKKIWHPDWPPGVFRFTVSDEESGESDSDDQ